MPRLNRNLTLFIVLSLIFVRLTGVHYLLCLDKQEPTSNFVTQMYVVGPLLSEDPCPPHNSSADADFELSLDSALAKVAHADLGLALLACALILLAIFPRARIAPIRWASPALYLSPPPFIRPQLRAPPL